MTKLLTVGKTLGKKKKDAEIRKGQRRWNVSYIVYAYFNLVAAHLYIQCTD